MSSRVTRNTRSGTSAARRLGTGRRAGSAVLAAVLVTAALVPRFTREAREARPAPEVADSPIYEPPPLEEVCGLVTRAEVEAALGAKVVGKPYDTRTRHGRGPGYVVGMRSCTFNGDSNGTSGVHIGLTSVFGPQVFKKTLAGVQAEYVDVERVRNLGDDAVSYFGGNLYVLKDTYLLHVAVHRKDQPPTDLFQAAPHANRERNVRLVLKALQRLPKERAIE